MRLERLSNSLIKEYITGINNNGEITTKTLNIFQLILRRVFGFYNETHHQNVMKNIVTSLNNKTIELSKEQKSKVSKFFNKKFLSAENENVTIQTNKFRIYQFTNESYKFSCHLKSASECEIRVENPFCIGVKLKATSPKHLDIVDCLISDQLLEKDPVFSELVNFLQHTLYHSQKVEKIYWENAPKQFKSDKVVQLEDPVMKNSWIIIDRPQHAPSDKPPLSLDFLLQICEPLGNF